ncbi:hypothetical protein [Bacteroides eggerthii]|uniref:hypothetical protein n=1 Tax=Bacteroides eggerthii TaxID=28111 RepID=UPI00189F806C|nr:hypothetical protein [Bacteroides eggerthii]
MEITVTMVKFSFDKVAMEKRTEKAQLFLCGDRLKPIKIWIPLNKMEMKEDGEKPTMNVIMIPKWLFMKTDLPFYTDTKEYVVKLEVNDVFYLISDSK